MWHKVLLIARQETGRFFGSPVAFIFFGTFLIVNLFVFFWVETFFSRNIADVRPLFDWMPVLLIFLVAALTMRMWSEEKRLGTLELLLTEPVPPWCFVAGKFLACMALVSIALLLTLPLPFTVNVLGNLDWGPVFGAYLATLFLAGAYTAIGLTVSARSENQIISLIGTVLVCSVFYLLGSDTLTRLFGNQPGEWLKLLGTGSRFTSITRGVIDLRDLYYYLSLIGVFLSLNVYFLETGRWAKESSGGSHGRWRLMTLLLVANLAIGNLWLQQVGWARLDLTQGRIYSISGATRDYLKQLQEPLLIRGYFSAKTHPLLAPLVPQLRDLIMEYQIASKGRIRSEFIDPLEHPQLEEEAGQKYGIRPVPFQVADRYQASVVNSYFDVVIQYGDRHEVLGFQELIEVKSDGQMDLDVKLRDPEYEITRSIKKVLYEYQSTGDLFSSLGSDIEFTGFVSAGPVLPEPLVEFQAQIETVLSEIKNNSSGRFDFSFVDPDASGGAVAREIEEQYGFGPMQAGLFDTQSFYFYMVLKSGDQSVQLPLPADLQAQSFRRALDAGLKRFASGFMKNIAVWTPPAPPPNPYMQQMPQGGKQFQFLQEVLRENHQVSTVDLADGFVPDDADLLLVLAPTGLEKKQLFAIDQFLMKGGTVILSTAPFESSISTGSLGVAAYDSGLAEWLDHFGIRMDATMVLDPQNAKLPIPVDRNIGGFTVQEIQTVEFPYFVDVRGEGLAQEGGMTTGVPQVTVNWASPVVVDEQKNAARRVETILQSSASAWTSDSTRVIPDYAGFGPLGFEPAQERARYTLGVAVEGGFESFFSGGESPLVAADENAKDDSSADGSNETDQQKKPPVYSGVIDKSPDSARLVVLASNEFLTDMTLQIAGSSAGTLYRNPLDLVENIVDWSLEDRGLLAIRGRGHFSRTLHPLVGTAQSTWEYLNYAFALIGLLLVYFGYRRSRGRAVLRHAEILGQGGVR